MSKLKNGFYDLAKTTPSPNRGGRITPTVIIVHDTASGLNSSGPISWLCNPAAKASAHFVIGRGGDVHQLISTNLKAWHAGVSYYNGQENVNNFSIGIELVNPGFLKPHGVSQAKAQFGAIFDRKKYGIEALDQFAMHPNNDRPTHPAGLWMPYSEAQLEALLKLCLAIRDKYGITEVVPHWYISQGRKIDTNPTFPLPWLQAKLEGRQDATVPGWDIAEEISEPEDPKLPPETCTLKQHAKVRQYPSFFETNVILTQPEQTLPLNQQSRWTILDNGMFNIAGEGILDEMQNEQLHWVKIQYEEITGWVLFSNIERKPYE